MVEFKIKIHPKQRLAYVPQAIYEVLTSSIRAIPNRTAVLLFAEGTSRQDVLISLEIIKRDIMHAEAMEKKAKVSR